MEGDAGSGRLEEGAAGGAIVRWVCPRRADEEKAGDDLPADGQQTAKKDQLPDVA